MLNNVAQRSIRYSFLVVLFTMPAVSVAVADSKPETTLAFRVVLPTLGYTIRNNAHAIDFATNNALIPTVSIRYNSFGVSYGSSSGKLDDSIAVSTTSHDFQGFYYFDKHGVDFYYQDYRGYYIDRVPIPDENYYPDLKARTYTVNYYYKLGGSNKLSAMSTAIPSAEPRSSLYYLLTSISDRSLKSGKNMIPQSNASDFPDISAFNNFHLVNATLSGGMYFPMHSGNWYLNPGISIGFGTPVKKYSDDLNTNYSIKVNLKASMGYAGKTYRYGLEVANDSDAFETAGENALQFHSIIVNLILFSYTF